VVVVFILCSVFIVCVDLYAVFRLIVVLFCVMRVICVLCLIVVPLPLDETPFAVKINNNNIKACCLYLWIPPVFKLVSCLAYSSILKIEATYSRQTSVEFQQTI
jgi:hypothetical protein